LIRERSPLVKLRNSAEAPGRPRPARYARIRTFPRPGAESVPPQIEAITFSSSSFGTPNGTTISSN